MKSAFKRAEAQKRRSVKLLAAIQRRKIEDEPIFKALGLDFESRNRSNPNIAWTLGGLFLVIILGGFAAAYEVRVQSAKAQGLERELTECREQLPVEKVDRHGD